MVESGFTGLTLSFSMIGPGAEGLLVPGGLLHSGLCDVTVEFLTPEYGCNGWGPATFPSRDLHELLVQEFAGFP